MDVDLDGAPLILDLIWFFFLAQMLKKDKHKSNNNKMTVRLEESNNFLIQSLKESAQNRNT